MKEFKTNKASLSSVFTNTEIKDLGAAAGSLKLCGLKVYLYLSSSRDEVNQALKPSTFADWLGADYSNTSQARAVRKIINDGIDDLIANGYVVVSDEKYEFSVQKVATRISTSAEK